MDSLKYTKNIRRLKNDCNINKGESFKEKNAT